MYKRKVFKNQAEILIPDKMSEGPQGVMIFM